MNSARRHIQRSLVLLTVFIAFAAAPTPVAPVPIDQVTPDSTEIAGMRPEGRLRKLHLVRPDLIPYPIAYEVYC